MKKITVKLTDVPVNYFLLNENVENAFKKYLVDEEGDISLGITEEDISRAKTDYEDDSPDAYVEYMELGLLTSDAFLEKSKCLFHGVAFIVKEKAYIFTAPSGTGKTTQYLLWKILYGDEIRMINGDKPFLDFSAEDGSVKVCPSPWLGKEGMGTMGSAELGGIIYLKQGSENTIRRMTPKEAVVPIYCQFVFSASTTKQVQHVCRLEEKLLKKVPVWELTNRGDKESARLCYDTIMQEEEKL